jgi:adenine C2-methylase RlmN of 23S rRNA A2503 and tRNA A37
MADVSQSEIDTAIAGSKITVSTVGLVPEMERFVAASPSVQMAVSLHATTDEVRDPFLYLSCTWKEDRVQLAFRSTSEV